MTATQAYVQPPPNNAAGPKVDAIHRLVGTDELLAQMITTGRLTKIVSATITRPGDTTTYATGDSVGVGLGFAGVARDLGGSGKIVAALLTDSGDETVKPDFELWLFGGAAAPATQTDNVAITAPSDAEILNLLGIIRFSTFYNGIAGTGGTCAAPGTIINGASNSIPFVCHASAKDIYGIVVARNAYVPLNAEVFTFRLFIEQD